MNMRQIIDKIYIFPFMGGFMNMYMAETPDGLLIVDAGLSAAMVQRAMDDLVKSGRKLEEVRYIFVTHAHPDHINGLAHLQKLTNAQTLAHPRESLVIRGEKPWLFAAPETLGLFSRLMLPAMKSQRPAPPARVDTEVKEGDTVAGMFQVIELPGHAYGQIGLWWPEHKLLIGGDVMMHFPWGLTGPIPPATPDMAEAKRSIKKVAEMGVETLGLGHGQPIVGSASARIETFAKKLRV